MTITLTHNPTGRKLDLDPGHIQRMHRLPGVCGTATRGAFTAVFCQNCFAWKMFVYETPAAIERLVEALAIEAKQVFDRVFVAVAMAEQEEYP